MTQDQIDSCLVDELLRLSDEGLGGLGHARAGSSEVPSSARASAGSLDNLTSEQHAFLHALSRDQASASLTAQVQGQRLASPSLEAFNDERASLGEGDAELVVDEDTWHLLEYCQVAIAQTKDHFRGRRPSMKETLRELLFNVRQGSRPNSILTGHRVFVHYSREYKHFFLRVRRLRSPYDGVAVDAWPDKAQAVLYKHHFASTMMEDMIRQARLNDTDLVASDKPVQWCARQGRYLHYQLC